MHDAPPTPQLPVLRPPEMTVLPADEPELRELFEFMAEAELRFESLRMRIVDRQGTTHGDETVTHDVWLRHTGFAKIVSTRGAATEGDYDVWVTDGESVRTFNAMGKLATRRRIPQPPVGSLDPELPSWARVYQALTPLQPETVADTFVHPHGFCRNVLSTGIVTRRGTAALAGGRETILLRCDHPRTSHVLNDRPDHWLEVGVDAQTGMLLLLAEHVGEQITRHAEAVNVSLDETIPDSAFVIHVSADTRTIY